MFVEVISKPANSSYSWFRHWHLVPVQVYGGRAPPTQPTVLFAFLWHIILSDRNHAAESTKVHGVDSGTWDDHQGAFFL